MAIGWWAHGGAAVHASSAPVGELSFQFVKSDLNNALTVYDAGAASAVCVSGRVGDRGGDGELLLHVPHQQGWRPDSA